VKCEQRGKRLIYCIGLHCALADRAPTLAEKVAEDCAVGEGRLTGRGCAFAEGGASS